MNAAKCMSLFVLFADLADGTPYQALLDAAISEVMQQLRTDADPSDVRLCYYAAAIAHLRYVQMLASRSEIAHSYAGNLTRESVREIPCGFAERLVSEYRTAAADLLVDRAFLFTGIA